MPRAIIGVDTVSLYGYVQATSRLFTLALVIWLFGKNREPSAALEKPIHGRSPLWRAEGNALLSARARPRTETADETGGQTRP